MTPTCETCRYWKFSYEDEGYCQRNAPHPKWSFEIPQSADESNNDGYAVYWPKTSHIDWCGEHQHKPAAPKADE